MMEILVLLMLGVPIVAFGAVLGWWLRGVHEQTGALEDVEAERQAAVLPFPERPGA